MKTLCDTWEYWNEKTERDMPWYAVWAGQAWTNWYSWTVVCHGCSAMYDRQRTGIKFLSKASGMVGFVMSLWFNSRKGLFIR